MRELTDRQKTVLQFVKHYVNEKHYPPCVRETAQYLGITPKGAYDHLKALEKKGCLRIGEGTSRSIELLDRSDAPSTVAELPLLGEVAAGRPIFADENFESTVCVPAAMLGAKPCFALRVRGDSMTGAGILDGDIAVIEQRTTANDGDIVVALMEDSVTLKRFYKEKGRVRLAPENPAYAPIYTQDLRILGKLRGLVRTY